jgi:hypothetical protein
MRDLVDAICIPPPSEDKRASFEHDRVPELLRLIGQRDLVAPERSAPQTPSAARAHAWPTYKTAAGDNPGADVSGSPDKHPLLWWPQVSGGVSLVIVGIAGSLRAYAWPAYQGKGMPPDDNPGAEFSGPPDKQPFLWSLRVPGGVGLTIAGIAGSVLIGAFAAVSYYALSALNTTDPAPVIAYSGIEPKATAVAQNDSGEARNEQGPKTFGSDQPIKVRTVTIRPDVGAANLSAAETSTSVESQLSTSAVPRAYPNSGERRDVGAASATAPAFSDLRSEPNIPPASHVGTNADAQKNVRASAARPQVATRSGGIACQIAPGAGGHWTWRLIDGRKCWYEGRSVISKDNLRWIR